MFVFFFIQISLNHKAKAFFKKHYLPLQLSKKLPWSQYCEVLVDVLHFPHTPFISSAMYHLLSPSSENATQNDDGNQSETSFMGVVGTENKDQNPRRNHLGLDICQSG